MSKPVRTFRCGSITAAVWSDSKVIGQEIVEMHSIRIDRAYKDGEEWKNTQTFAAEDLPKVAMVASEAYKSLRLRSSENNDICKNVTTGEIPE